MNLRVETDDSMNLVHVVDDATDKSMLVVPYLHKGQCVVPFLCPHHKAKRHAIAFAKAMCLVLNPHPKPTKR